jgi:OmcA/MtrC family decaheme c-type cytochrome
MVAVQRGLLVLMAAGALALPSQVPVGSDGAETPVKKNAREAVTYSSSQREAYLTPDQLDYIRPGLKVTINSVSNMEAGKKPVVEFTITDDFGNPLDRTGATTVGTVTYRFVPAVWDGTYYKDQLVAANGNPTRDNTGTTQTIDIGHYKYTFALALPATYDPTKPATLFGGFVRNTSAIVGKNYYAQVFKDFVPSTGAAATTWAVTTTQMCNNCHTPDLGSTASPHGGNYREAKTCALCHNPNNMTGATLAQFNGQVFWHQLHAGINEEFEEVTFPRDLRTCAGCHDPAAAQGSNWYTQPTRAACGSCHTNVNFATGAGHSDANLPQANDSACATCHIPQGDAEFDASIKGAHTLPYDSKQLKGLNITLVSVTNAAPGQKPTVKFTLKQNDGTSIKQVAAGPFVNLFLGGQTTGYFRQPISESALNAAFDAATSVYTYTFTNPFPADAKGSWSVSASTRQTVQLQKADGTTIAYTEGAVNPITYVSMTSAPAVARRTVVTLDRCNVCHAKLSFLFSHGGQRIATQFCVICHNGNGSDTSRRPASAAPAESISMQRMIHRIHTGTELTQDYTVYGFGGNPTNFNEVTYPGYRGNCVACHTSGTYNPPVEASEINVVTLRDYFTPQGPTTASCLGCHDVRDAEAHAYLNTSPFGEACGTCHGANSDWSPDKVHAQ